MIPFFSRSSYRPLNRVLVSQNALKANLEYFRKMNPKKEICPVLKSNAYGHGLITVAKILDSENCAFFIVDSLYEAYELKKAKIKTPILILGFNFPENLKRSLPFQFVASDLESLKRLIDLKLPFHLELDTGMHRLGLERQDLERAVDMIKSAPHLFKGLFSHLMTADYEDETLLRAQEKLFVEGLQFFSKQGLKPEWVHLGNSAGAAKINFEGENMLRIGLRLYGIDCQQPALEVQSSIIAIHDLKKGDTLSYGASYTAESDITVGILPFGYYEGLPISLSNIGKLYFKEKPCRILGRINMNHCFIDLTRLDAKIGDPVQVYSQNPELENSISKIARDAGTIPYEILVRLSPTIRRIVVS